MWRVHDLSTYLASKIAWRTLRLYGIGKRAALRKLTNNASFRNDVRLFTNESTLDKNTVAGKRALCCYYVCSDECLTLETLAKH